MLHVGGQHFFQIQHLRRAVNQCKEVDTRGDLQIGLFEQAVPYHVGVRVAFQFDDDTHTETVGFFFDVGNALEFLVLDLVGDILNQ